MTDKQIRMQLAAAQETINMLTKRVLMLEGAEQASPLLQQLNHYQDSMRARNLAMDTLVQALDEAGDGIVITDCHAHIEYVNQAYERITGYCAKELIGENPSLLHSGQQDDSFYGRMWAELVQRGEWTGQICNSHKNGELYPASLHIRAIKQEDGHTIRYIGILADLTRQHTTEDKMRQIQKLESVSIMVGGVAHHFNNILAGISGNIYLAERKLGDHPDVAGHLSTVEGLCQEAAEIVSQMMTFSRQSAVVMKQMEVGESARQMVKLVRFNVPDNVVFQCQISEQSMTICGDEKQLQQMLFNLVDNAYKAVQGVQAPEIKVTLLPFLADDDFKTVHADAGKESFVLLQVSDNGCGIQPDNMAHIFEPFFTTRDVGEGTGLGLSMVYGAVQGHGGIVDVQSEPGLGTQFNIYLPLVKQGAGKAERTAGGETILIADDDALVLKTTADVLEHAGFQVLQASDGQQAWELFQQQHADIALLLLDIVMPHMDGVQFALKARTLAPAMPVIFATGYDQSDSAEQRSRIGNSESISKPFSFTTLNQTIRRMIDQS